MPSLADVLILLCRALLLLAGLSRMGSRFRRTAVAGGVVIVGLVHSGPGVTAAPPSAQDPMASGRDDRVPGARGGQLMLPKSTNLTDTVISEGFSEDPKNGASAPAPLNLGGEESPELNPLEAIRARGGWIFRFHAYRPYVFFAIGSVAVLAALCSRRLWMGRSSGGSARRSVAVVPPAMPATPAPPDALLAVGDEAVLICPDGKGVWLAVDAAARDAIRDAEKREDIEEVTFLMASRRIFWQSNGTRVEVLQTPDGSAQVCIRDGPHRGAEVWARCAFVRRLSRRSRRGPSLRTSALPVSTRLGL